MIKTKVHRDWRLLVQDIVLTVDLLEAYLRDHDDENFLRDQRAVIMACFNLKIIGEAVANLPADLLEKHPQIPWIFLRNLRNPITNNYYRNDPRVTWITLHSRVFPIALELGKLLEIEFQKVNGTPISV